MTRLFRSSSTRSMASLPVTSTSKVTAPLAWMTDPIGWPLAANHRRDAVAGNPVRSPIQQRPAHAFTRQFFTPQCGQAEVPTAGQPVAVIGRDESHMQPLFKGILSGATRDTRTHERVDRQQVTSALGLGRAMRRKQVNNRAQGGVDHAPVGAAAPQGVGGVVGQGKTTVLTEVGVQIVQARGIVQFRRRRSEVKDVEVAVVLTTAVPLVSAEGDEAAGIIVMLGDFLDLSPDALVFGGRGLGLRAGGR